MYYSSVTLAPTQTMNQEYEEGFKSGVFEIGSRLSIFKNAMKANVVIEALGIFHRSYNDRFECISPYTMMRKLGYLQGVISSTIAIIPSLEGSSKIYNTMMLLGMKYSECMMKVLHSPMLSNYVRANQTSSYIPFSSYTKFNNY